MLLQKLLILWDKKRFLTLLEMESEYLITTKGEILKKDTPDLRGRLAKLRLIKNPKNETQREIIEIQAQINEVDKFKQMIVTTEEKKNDLKSQITFYKKSLWR